MHIANCHTFAYNFYMIANLSGRSHHRCISRHSGVSVVKHLQVLPISSRVTTVVWRQPYDCNGASEVHWRLWVNRSFGSTTSGMQPHEKNKTHTSVYTLLCVLYVQHFCSQKSHCVIMDHVTSIFIGEYWSPPGRQLSLSSSFRTVLYPAPSLLGHRLNMKAVFPK